MTNAPRGDVDLRGFAWPLAPLACHVAITAERAAAEVARCERIRLARCEELEDMQREHGQQLLALAGLGTIDPMHRRQSLLFLARGLDRLMVHEQVLQAAAAAVETARQAHRAAEHRRECLQRLHDAAVENHAAHERRRVGKEADQAWLAGLFRLRAAAREGVGT